jgi:hypothetical protein
MRVYPDLNQWQDIRAVNHCNYLTKELTMLKQLSILVVLSALLLIFAQHTQLVLSYLDASHTFLNAKLSYIFNTSEAGNTTQEVTCLLVIPMVLTIIPASIYWLVKRKLMPYFYHVLWTIWIVLFTTLTLSR